MRCKDIELLIIESSERELSQEERLKVKQHTAGCSACELFRKSFSKIRISIKNGSVPSLPEDLEEKTRRMCHAELESRAAGASKADRIKAALPIPKLIWAALFILTGLTVVILVPHLKDLSFDQTMNFQTALFLTLIFQNAAMLIFSPVLIRKFRMKNDNFGAV